nr:ABC transporter permease DevC [Gloeothece verrucosa]
MLFTFFRLPAAWLQLKYQKIRLVVALAGVVFAVVIIFMQLGIRDALFNSAVRLHEGLQGDCFLISPRSTALIAMEKFPERRLLQVLGFDEVDFVSPIYLDFAQWKNPNTKNYWRNIFVIGYDLRNKVFDFPGVEDKVNQLQLDDTVLFDKNSRTEFGTVAQDFLKNHTVTTELSNRGSNRKIEVVGLFELGTSFGSDGNLITSYTNFLRIFNNRSRGLIDIGLIKLNPNVDREIFINKLKKYLPNDVKIFSKQEFINFEKNYWQTSTAIGFIFNLGVSLGIIVGVVVVYQILYTNVSEHLSEYATLKAIGYHHRYLLLMVVQQAFIIAILGFIPGFIISEFQYYFAKQSTLLPIQMTFDRAMFVFTVTLGMCLISGATAVRKLKQADPADIF